MFIPKLIFYYAGPFDRGRRALFVERGTAYPSQKEVRQKVMEYRALWEEENKDGRIMKLVVERTGVTVPRDIEVFVFGTGMNAMSYPFLIPALGRDSVPYSREKTLEVLVHESLHRFLSENIVGGEEYAILLGEYAEESVVTRNHIFIYAFLEIILGELYGKNSLNKFINPQSAEYKRAVEIVAEKGAQNIVSKFRNFIASQG